MNLPKFKFYEGPRLAVPLTTGAMTLFGTLAGIEPKINRKTKKVSYEFSMPMAIAGALTTGALGYHSGRKIYRSLAHTPIYEAANKFMNHVPLNIQSRAKSLQHLKNKLGLFDQIKFENLTKGEKPLEDFYFTSWNIDSNIPYKDLKYSKAGVDFIKQYPSFSNIRQDKNIMVNKWTKFLDDVELGTNHRKDYNNFDDFFNNFKSRNNYKRNTYSSAFTPLSFDNLLLQEGYPSNITTQSELKKLYLKRMIEIHPDKFPNSSPEKIRELTIKTQELNAGWEKIINHPDFIKLPPGIMKFASLM